MRIKRIDWQISAAYVGTVIGAGFASGQELMQFFVKFGWQGLWGVTLAGLFFTVLGGMTIVMTRQYGFRTYKDLLDLKLGSGLAWFIDEAVMLFLFLGFSVMLSGSGTLFKEHLGLSPWIGVSVTETLVFLALAGRHEGVLWFNCLLSPLLVIVLLFVSVGSFFVLPVTHSPGPAGPGAGSWVSDNWFLSALLYVSYNMVGAIVVLVALTAGKRECGLWGGVIGGMILFVLAFCAATALLWAGDALAAYQLPMLFLAYRVNPLMFYLYGAVLWAAMITTAVSDAYGLCRRLQFAWNLPYFLVIVVILIAAFPLALCDFAQLIAKVYPLFGYLSLIVTLVLTLHTVKIVKSRLARRKR